MRRLTAVVGIVLLLGGMIAAVVLLVLGPRYRDQQIEQMARAAVGCTTPLVFTEAGEFLVFQEVASPQPVATSGCPATPGGAAFGFELTGTPEPVVTADAGTVGYDSAGALATSVARIEVEAPGTYQITVHGPVADTVAAVGRDPGATFGSYRRAALIVGIVGVVLGVATLARAGRRRPPSEPSGAPSETPPWPAPSAPPTGAAAP